MSNDNVAQKDLKAVIEDNALQRVPESERQGWLAMSWNTMGIVTTLVQLLVGATCTFIAGIWVGLIAGITVAIVGGILGSLVGHVAYKQGLSNTVLARYHGFGVKGSILASGIFGFMIIGMLALENALLYEGLLFFFKLPNTMGNAILIYGILTILWIVLATFGINLVTKVSSVTIVAFLAVLAYMLFTSAPASGLSWNQLLTHGPVFPGGNTLSHYITCINIMIGSAGALALCDADFGRFSKSTKDIAIAAFLGNLMMDVIMMLTGSILVYAGFETVQKYYIAQGMAAEAASNAALTNVGATFIIIGGVVGTILMLFAQSKAQVLNTYTASLALSNLGDALNQRHSRFVMVILANIIGMLMIAGNILGLINSWLTLLGVITTCQAVIMVADYFIVQKGKDVSQIKPDFVNWAGVITAVVATAAAMLLVNVIPVQFITSSIISLVLYPILRTKVLTQSTQVSA